MEQKDRKVPASFKTKVTVPMIRTESELSKKILN